MSELIQYKCPCCGGAVEFNSTAQKMKCPYCDTEFEIETLKKYDEELKQEKQKEDQMQWQEDAGSQWGEEETSKMRVYHCESCGGEIIAECWSISVAHAGEKSLRIKIQRRQAARSAEIRLLCQNSLQAIFVPIT